MNERRRSTDGYEMIEDGGRVTVNMMVMDSMQSEISRQMFDARDHQPGFRHASDAERAAVRDARDAMIERAENAWRSPPNVSRDAGSLTPARDRRSGVGISRVHPIRTIRMIRV